MVTEITDLIIPTINLMIAAWGVWGQNKKVSLEKLAKELLKNEKVRLKLENDDRFKDYFFSIFEKVLKDSRRDKIKFWKHSIINLAANFNDFDLKDSFLKILDDLTFFDFTVLNFIYYDDNLNKSENDDLSEKIEKHFIEEGYDVKLIKLSLNRLKSNRLIESMESKYDEAIGALCVDTANCKKNDFGLKFINFISENEK